MSMKRWFWITLFLFLLWSPAANAEVFLTDDFHDLSKVNTSQTTAEVDTQDGWVQLVSKSLPNALALEQYVGKGYGVATTDGVSFYAMNSSTGTLQELPGLKINVANPLAVSLYHQDMSGYVLLPTGDIRYFSMSGSGFVENPAYSILGVGSVISISSSDGTAGGKKLFTLDGSGQVKAYGSTGSSMVPVPNLTVNTGLADPVSISAVPENDTDFVVSTKTGAFYYAYDGSAYHPISLLTGLSGIVSAQVDASGDLIAALSQKVVVYVNSGGGNLVDATTVIGPANITNPTSVSLNTDLYQYGVLTSDGQVHYYEVSGGVMGENTAMNLTGLHLNHWYESPLIYVSQPSSSTYPVDVVRLTTTEQNDSNTNVAYEVSTDGGTTFTPVTVGNWTDITPGTSLVLRATLSTSNPLNTPRILQVTLEGGQLSVGNLTATKQYMPGPNQKATLPTTIFPVYERTGGQVEFTVTTTGAATQAVATFSDGTTQNLIPINPITNETNTWFGWYEVPLSAPQGEVVGITVVASRGSHSKSLVQPNFIQVDGTTQSQLKIRLIQ
jgi:hypothetical protein